MKIGLLVGDFETPYTLSVFKWISHEVISRNADLIVIEGQDLNGNSTDYISYNSVLRILTGERLDGLIVLTPTLLINSSIKTITCLIKNLNIPVVSFGISLDEIPSVTIDNYSGAYKAVAHLISHNYKKLAIINGPMYNPEAVQRKNAFFKAALDNKLDIPSHLILEGTFDYISGYNEAEKLLPYIKDGSVDAVVCSNDCMALAAMYCFFQNGIRIPEDVAVVGFGDLPLASYSHPALTTVRQGFDIMSEKAADILFDSIMGKKNSRVRTINPELIIRQSCGCEDKNYQKSFFPCITYNNIVGRLQHLENNEFFDELTRVLEVNRINHCYIVSFTDHVQFNEPANRITKASLIYGYSNKSRVSYQKSYPFEKILPGYIFDKIHEPMVLKPLSFDGIQFGFLYISAIELTSSFINSLGLELIHYFEIQHLSKERKNAEERLNEALESLRASNKRLNELTVKSNLERVASSRHLSANLMQYRKENTGDYILLIVEIDDFSEINARYGFTEGEYVMSRISHILADSIREDDFLSHQSCERYVILIKNVLNNPVEGIIERFQKGINRINYSSGKPYTISFNWGWAFAGIESDLNLVYLKAEQSLMENKSKKHFGL